MDKKPTSKNAAAATPARAAVQPHLLPSSSRCTHPKLDVFRAKLKRFKDENEQSTDLETVGKELSSLIADLGQLAPDAALSVENVTAPRISAHLRDVLGSSPIRLETFLTELADARSVHLRDTKAGTAADRQRFFAQRKAACNEILRKLSGTIHAMGEALAPLGEPLRNSPHAKEINTAHFKLVKRFADAYMLDRGTAEAAPVLKDYDSLATLGQKAQHVVALVEFRDALQAIFEQKYDQPTAVRNLIARVKEYASAIGGRPCALEPDTMRRAIDRLTSAPTNDDARVAIDTISTYTHNFLARFNGHFVHAYKADHETLKKNKPKALEYSSAMLDAAYNMRWAGAAHTMFEQIGAHEGALRTPPKQADVGASVTSWGDFAAKVKSGEIKVGIGRTRGSSPRNSGGHD